MENIPSHKLKKENFKKRFLASGLANFTDNEIIEFILSYGMPYTDNFEVAVKTIKACGSISAIMDAPHNILEEFGINENASILIKMIPQIGRVYLEDKYSNVSDKDNPRTIRDKIIASFIGTEGEQVVLGLLDDKDNIKYFGVVNKGSINASEIYIRKIIELSMKHNAVSAVIAHNHPSGVAYPSSKDINSTIKLHDALAAIHVRLTNHFIVAGAQCYSMASNEEYFDMFL